MKGLRFELVVNFNAASGGCHFFRWMSALNEGLNRHAQRRVGNLLMAAICPRCGALKSDRIRGGLLFWLARVSGCTLRVCGACRHRGAGRILVEPPACQAVATAACARALTV